MAQIELIMGVYGRTSKNGKAEYEPKMEVMDSEMIEKENNMIV